MFTLKAKSQNIILVNRKLIICRKMELNEFLSMSQCIYSVKCWLDVFWIGFLKMFKCLFASTASAIEAEQPRDRAHLPSTGLLPEAQGWTRLMFWASVWLLKSWSRNPSPRNSCCLSGSLSGKMDPTWDVRVPDSSSTRCATAPAPLHFAFRLL